jgi:hypothetical protein
VELGHVLYHLKVVNILDNLAIDEILIYAELNELEALIIIA